MTMFASKLLISWLFLFSLTANSAELAKSHGNLGIPYKLTTDERTSDIIVSKDKITIHATKGTDLYTDSSGTNSNDNAPRIFFEPKSDFTLSAKVTANFTTSYDGGALFLYADTEHWGKLLFERFKSGDNGIASTVTRSTGDDAYHHLIDNNEIYLKIVRRNNSFTFFYSKDGEKWLYLRSFSMLSPKPIKVGFLAQSPISETHKVVYSDIQFIE